MQPNPHQSCSLTHTRVMQPHPYQSCSLKHGPYQSCSLTHTRDMQSHPYQSCSLKHGPYQSCSLTLHTNHAACLESPNAALHAGSYGRLLAGTVVELWQHKIANVNRMIENRPTARPHSSKTKGDVTHYPCMFRISKGCSSCWKLRQTLSWYGCGVMAAQNRPCKQDHRNRPSSRPHSSKTKGGVNLQASCFHLVQVACS